MKNVVEMIEKNIFDKEICKKYIRDNIEYIFFSLAKD